MGPTEKLTLWQTFKVLYKQNTMVKYYLISLLILLGATSAILAITILNMNSSSSKDCASASYATEHSAVLRPMKHDDMSDGGFGPSLSASSSYLVVGAPEPVC